MREAHPVERAVGIERYVSDADGIGGRLRAAPADFRVREIEAFDPEPLDADPGAYPHLLARVTLRGWDTNDFAGAVSDGLGVSRERVSWAGTKDKDAVTTQLVSLATVDPEDVRDLAVRDADVVLLGRTGRPILFGDLAGNAFEIVVRDVDEPGTVGAITDDLRRFATGTETDDPDTSSEPGETCATSEETETASADADGSDATVGVPNYFGQQRFGSERPVTHEVGLEIVRGNWRGAVLAYVGNPHDRERAGTRDARAYVDEAEDWEGALDRLPNRLGYERSMCHRLVERGPDLAAEDYRAALEAVPTNLQRLFVHAAQSYVFNRILSERLERGLPFHLPVAGDVVCFADADAPAGLALPDVDRTQRVTDSRLRTVRRHCERGRAFVTAPLVGTETELAGGEPGEIERSVLGDEDLAPGDFDLPGEFDSAGTRRAVLLRTDLGVAPTGDADSVRFEFSLPKGSYATVVLREYLKSDPGDL